MEQEQHHLCLYPLENNWIFNTLLKKNKFSEDSRLSNLDRRNFIFIINILNTFSIRSGIFAVIFVIKVRLHSYYNTLENSIQDLASAFDNGS